MGAGQEASVEEENAATGVSAEARADILDAARRIVVREGAENFTLSAVAREASVAHNTIFSLYRNKNELLMALAASDLNSASQAMNGGKPDSAIAPLPHADLAADLIDKVERPERPEFPADTIVPMRAAGALAVADPGEPLTLGEETVTLENEIPQGETSVAELPSVARRRGEAAQLHEIVSRLTLPAAALGEGSAQAVARVDRRIALVERALAELEDRFDKFAKGANDSIHTTEASLESLVQRLDRTEQRIGETASTLRGELLVAFTRIEPPKTEPPRVNLPETSAAAAGPEAETGPEKQPAPPEAAADLRSQLHRPAVGGDLCKPQGFGGNASRRMRKPHKRKHLLSRQQLLGIGAISIAVILATMGIALSEGFIDVKSGHIGPPPVHLVESELPLIPTTPPPQAEASLPPAPAPATSPVKLANADIQNIQAVKAAIAGGPAVIVRQPRKLSALERIELLANGGNAKAATIFGIKYLEGDGVLRDDAKAAAWLTRAAKSGEPIAQYRLGTLYQRGVGVVQDDNQAFRWYEAAAQQGNRKAMHNLGVFYAEGRGTTQDYEKAAGWFLRAAKLGYVDSQFDLAVLYERGAGVPQDIAQAYKWYSIAAHNGDEVSSARIDVLETQLEPSEAARMKEEARAFRAEPLSRAANSRPLLVDLQ